jgi:hypothetical protein
VENDREVAERWLDKGFMAVRMDAVGLSSYSRYKKLLRQDFAILLTSTLIKPKI